MISAFSLRSKRGEDAQSKETKVVIARRRSEKREVTTLTQMRRQERTRGAARLPSRRYTRNAPEDQLPRSPAAQIASSNFSRARQYKKKGEDNETHSPRSTNTLPNQLTFAWARALISAEALIIATSAALFTLRSFPTSGASGLRLDAGTTSIYDPTSATSDSPSVHVHRCLRER